jgi:hypothetical protein
MKPPRVGGRGEGGNIYAADLCQCLVALDSKMQDDYSRKWTEWYVIEFVARHPTLASHVAIAMHKKPTNFLGLFKCPQGKCCYRMKLSGNTNKGM